jgi:hypothetical protein
MKAEREYKKVRKWKKNLTTIMERKFLNAQGLCGWQYFSHYDHPKYIIYHFRKPAA